MRTLQTLVLASLVSALGTFSHQSLMAGAKEDPEREAQKLLVAQWEQMVRKKTDKQPNVKKLLGKYPLVLLLSRQFYAKGNYGFSAYDFVRETNDEEKFGNAHLLFMNGAGAAFQIEINLATNQQNLVVDLGKWDFDKDPDPKKITLNQSNIYTSSVKVQVGKVYLERVRDDRGNNFYALLQVVDVDPQSHYVAFIWRKLPGGKVVKN
jgi:hypothetical protein